MPQMNKKRKNNEINVLNSDKKIFNYDYIKSIFREKRGINSEKYRKIKTCQGLTKDGIVDNILHVTFVNIFVTNAADP